MSSTSCTLRNTNSVNRPLLSHLKFQCRNFDWRSGVGGQGIYNVMHLLYCFLCIFLSGSGENYYNIAGRFNILRGQCQILPIFILFQVILKLTEQVAACMADPRRTVSSTNGLEAQTFQQLQEENENLKVSCQISCYHYLWKLHPDTGPVSQI